MIKISINLLKFLLIMIGFFAIAPHSASAATYNWYFSNSSGNDATGNGTEAGPWKTLAKAQSQENTLSSSDTANFYFKRGDTWTFSHTGSPTQLIAFNNSVANIDAYGSGAAPIFDGGIDFATNPLTGSRHFFDSVFSIEYTGSTIKNLEIKNHYGWGVLINCPAKNVTVQHVTVHNIGHEGITSSSNCENYGNLVEYSTVYDAQRLEEKGYTVGNYGGGIAFTGMFGSYNIAPHDNTVRYCHVYDVYGEGIWNPEGTTEYNVIGTTWSAGIHHPAQGWNARTNIVRYNLIYGSPNGRYSAGEGILVADDETAFGDDSHGEFWCYGNTIIYRSGGIRMYDFGGYMVTHPYGKVRVFNNTMIDCREASISATEPDSFADVKFYNNASIFYQIAPKWGTVIDDFASNAKWTIGNNFFWPIDGTHPVDSTWLSGYRTGDPKLPKTTGWNAITTDKDIIDFLTMLYPEAGSALLGNGMALSSEFNGMTNLLTAGTHFDGNLGPASFVLQDQRVQSAFSLGAVLRSSSDTTPPAAPSGLVVD